MNCYPLETDSCTRNPLMDFHAAARDRRHPPAHARIRRAARACRSRAIPPTTTITRTSVSTCCAIAGEGARRRAVGAAGAEGVRRHGLPIVGWAAMYEEANRSIFGPVAFNCQAPDDGNMNLLALVGTEAQKENWLRPIVDGRVRSSFVMTEPAPGGGSDPGMIRTRAEKTGRQMGDPRPQVVHHRRRHRRSFHSGCAHLGRSRGTGSRRSCFTATSRAGASCGAFRSWDRRSTAAIASCCSTASKSPTRTC